MTSNPISHYSRLLTLALFVLCIIPIPSFSQVIDGGAGDKRFKLAKPPCCADASKKYAFEWCQITDQTKMAGLDGERLLTGKGLLLVYTTNDWAEEKGDQVLLHFESTPLKAYYGEFNKGFLKNGDGIILDAVTRTQYQGQIVDYRANGIGLRARIDQHGMHIQGTETRAVFVNDQYEHGLTSKNQINELQTMVDTLKLAKDIYQLFFKTKK